MGIEMKVVLSKAAERDIQEAVEYYENARQGLGFEFLEQIDDTLDRLSQFHAFSVRYDDVRIIRMRRFPYVLHYVVQEASTVIEVDMIRHMHQDSDLQTFFE